MTVPIETSRVTYTGNGVTTAFPTAFYFQASAQVRVRVTPLGDVETVLTEGVHYTVTTPTRGSGSGGTVNFLAAPAVDTAVVIERDVSLVQLAALRTVGTFEPEVHEDALDYVMLAIQEVKRDLADVELAAGAASIAAGSGLTSTGAAPVTLHVGAGAGISVNADTVEVDYGGAGAMVQVRAAAASAGMQDAAARIDHKHDVYTSPPGAGGVVAGGFATEGTAQGLARADHTHQVLMGTPVAVTKSANVEGVAATFARSDHKHDVTTAAAGAITDSTNAEGSATTLARSDHQHAHGVRGGGTLHAEATTSTAGFLSAADKTKLDGLLAETAGAAKVTTTDATPTELLRWTPTNQTAELVELDVVGKRLTANEAAGYRIIATITRHDGVTRIVAQTALVTHEDIAGWAVTVAASSPAISVTVTGAGGSTIDWYCTVRRKVAPGA